LGGGSVNTDVFNGLYFSNALAIDEFYNPTTSAVNFIKATVQSRLVGLKSFVQPTEQGTNDFLILGFENDTFVIDSLSSTSTLARFENIGMTSPDNIIGTPVGTIMVNNENAYLFRAQSYPIAVGNEIAEILKNADLSNSVADFHDYHYKLSLYSPDFSTYYGADYAGTQFEKVRNNIELWLDIRKIRQLDGRTCWYGPMVNDNYAPRHMLVDGVVNERYSICGPNNQSVCLMDTNYSDTSVEDDYGSTQATVRSILESKDYVVSKEDIDWNKLYTRQYWRINVGNTESSPAVITDETICQIDNRTDTDSQQINVYNGLASESFDGPLFVKPIFPSIRLRGRTIRKRLTTDNRISIGGLAIHYRKERRRI
jgi:hypothetical protein